MTFLKYYFIESFINLIKQYLQCFFHKIVTVICFKNNLGKGTEIL